jgi:hypothetical protein
MTPKEFRTEIIDHYWPDLWKTLDASKPLATNKARTFLVFDYEEIGSFLSDTARVERFLVPLETEIRRQLVAQACNHSSFLNFPRTPEAVKPLATSRKHGGANAHLKAHKVLTNALRRFEAEAGFNHERIQNGSFFADTKEGTLFSTAARSDGKGGLTRVTEKMLGREPKPDELNKVKLPQGVPTIVGDLDALAFNPLLRHGYQFKDVGAGPYHGEYTHRLQWYAIVAARAAGEIELFNTPLEIYRSLGYLSAKAPDEKNGGKVPVGSAQQLWMWQALFDTAEDATRARELKTLAYQTKAVYTCPESMNKALISAEFLQRTRYDENDASNLWCLRTLLATRWKKRFDESEGLVIDGKTQKPTLSGVPKLEKEIASRHTTEVYSSAVMSQEMKTYKTHTTTAWENGVKKSVVKQVEGPTETRSVETPTVQHAGYALAWYLRDSSVL